MSHLAPEEKQYYSAALAQTHCFSTNEPQGGPSTITEFGNFLNDMSKMSFSKQDPTLKKNCFGDPTAQPPVPTPDPATCLKTVSGNHSQYGGLLGPVPVSDGYLRDPESGKLQYQGVDSKNGLLRNLGLSHAVTSAIGPNGNWVITDKTDPKNPKTATLKLGDTDRNPFYCSGKGFCGGTDFESCACDSGYQSGDGTCKPIQQEYNCVQKFSTAKALFGGGITRQCVPKEATDSAAAAYKTKADCSAACNAYMFNPSAGNEATSCDKASQYDWCGICKREYQSCDDACRTYGRPNYKEGGVDWAVDGELPASMPVNGTLTQWSGDCGRRTNKCACGPVVPDGGNPVLSCMNEGKFWCYGCRPGDNCKGEDPPAFPAPVSGQDACYSHGSSAGNAACPGKNYCVADPSEDGGCACTDPSDTTCGYMETKLYRI